MSNEPWGPARLWSRTAHFGGGGSSGGSSSSTTSEPWEKQAPFLEDLYKKAQAAWGQTSRTPYSGPITAGPTTAQQQGVKQAQQTAQQYQGAGASTAQLGQDMAAGKYLTPESNPALQAGISAALNPIYDRYTEQVLPGITSRAISEGAYGGSRHGLGLAQGAQDLNREALDASSRIAYDNYRNERALQLQAPGLIQQGLGLDLTPSDIMLQTGAQQQQWNQIPLNDAITRYNLAQQAPWQGLSNYSQIVQGGFPGSATTSTAQQGSQAGNAISGALGGASLAGGLGSLAGATGLSALAPWLGIGAVLGGAGSFF